MSNRRMISKTVVESGRFLKMPLSSQCLYFHLVLNADDDGIVEAYTVINMCGAKPDDLRILVENEFVYVLNEEMVTYIEDWREMNTLRADRKTDSRYKSLLLQVRPDVVILEKKQRSDIKNKLPAARGPSMDRPRTAQDNLNQSNLNQNKSIEDNLNQSNQSNEQNEGLLFGEPIDGSDLNDAKIYEELIAKRIDLNSLRMSAHVRGVKSEALLEDVYNAMCSIVCHPPSSVKIKGQSFSGMTVKSQFLKLGKIQVMNVLSRLEDKEGRIAHPRDYIISSLYLESINNPRYDQYNFSENRKKEHYESAVSL